LLKKCSLLLKTCALLFKTRSKPAHFCSFSILHFFDANFFPYKHLQKFSPGVPKTNCPKTPFIAPQPPTSPDPKNTGNHTQTAPQCLQTNTSQTARQIAAGWIHLSNKMHHFSKGN
jgi:hypothetical protein